MPAQILGPQADVTMLNRVFNDQSPSYNVYINQVAAVESLGGTQFALQFGAGFQGHSVATLANMLMKNLGLLPNAELERDLGAYIALQGKFNVGIIALQLGQILSGLESANGELAIYAPAAVKWNEEVGASHTHSNNPANTSVSPITGGPPPGVTIVLTAFDDAVSPDATQTKQKSTGLDDVILASVPGLLNTGDRVDGGSGYDELRVRLAAGEVVAPLLQNMETVVIFGSAGAEFNVGRSSGINTLRVEASTGALKLTDVGLATMVGIRDSSSGGALTLEYAGAEGAADAASIVLADATGADEVIVKGIENLTVWSVAGYTAGTMLNKAKVNARDAEKITIVGHQDLITTITGAHVSVIDASAFSGALGLSFVTMGSATAAVAGGTRADALFVDDASGARLVIGAGDGADTVNIGAHNSHKITLGGGADVLVIRGLAGTASKDLDIGTAAGLASSAIEVTDFVSGTDVIQLTSESATAKAMLSRTELASIAESSSLLEAVALAAATAGATTAIAFRFGADTYILVNDGTAALGANDSLVKLTSVASLADASWAMA